MGQQPYRHKVIVITGASSGLGDATARHLGETGARLVLAARRADKLNDLAAELAEQGVQALAVRTDATRREDMKALASKALQHFGRIDVWINNDGLMPLSPLSKLLVDQWDQMIA